MSYFLYSKRSYFKHFTVTESVLKLMLWLPYLRFTKYLLKRQTVETLIGLLIHEQSDLDVHCFYWPFYR